MGSFFNNPDDPGFGMNSDFNFDFALADPQQELDWSVASGMQHMAPHDFARSIQAHHAPHILRQSAAHDHTLSVLSRQGFSPVHDPGQQQFGAGFDEGHMGANALLNMSHNSPGIQRNEPRRSSDFGTQNGMNQYPSQVLDAVRFAPAPAMGTHAPIHAPSMANFNRASSGQSWNNSPGPSVMIPNELPFNTDQTFAFNSHASQGALISPGAGIDAEKAARRGMNHSNYPLFGETTNAQLATPPQSMHRPGPPTSTRSQGADIPTTLGKDDQVIKRMRTKLPPQGIGANESLSSPGSQKVKAEASDGSRRGSTASSHSDNAGSPVPAVSKRRSQVGAASAAAQAASNTKRQKLSEAQRKANHIQSEKRRRAEMKQGYDQLDKLVPSLKSGGLSKAQVLQQTVVFLDALVEGNKQVDEEISKRLNLVGQRGGHLAYDIAASS